MENTTWSGVPGKSLSDDLPNQLMVHRRFRSDEATGTKACSRKQPAGEGSPGSKPKMTRREAPIYGNRSTVRACWRLYGSLYAGLGVEQMFGGSAFRDRSRTFLRVDVTLRVDCGKKRRDGEKRHYFAWEDLPGRTETDEKEPAPRADPVRIAQEWKRAMEERGESRANLARRLGVSRARVTQVLSVLDLAPEALELLERQSGPGIVSERWLRGLTKLPLERQRERLTTLVDRAGTKPRAPSSSRP